LKADTTFKDLKIPSHYEGKLTKMGLHTPTEVQAAAIPQLMAEKNMLLQWVTGSGKTLAYLLPAFAKVDRKVDALQLLVLVPTRELAVQVARVCEQLVRHGSKDWKQQPVVVQYFTGPTTPKMIRKLTDPTQTAHVVVATPPVAKIILEKQYLKLSHVKTFVMDEVDKLFEPELKQYTEFILDMVSKQELHNHKYMNQPSKPTGANVLPIVQHVYVSATITDTVRSVAKKYMNQREKCMDAGEDEAPRMPAVLKHFYVNAKPGSEPADYISKLHAAVKPVGASLVFTKNVVEANLVLEELRKRRFRAAILTAHIPKDRKERAALIRKVARNSVNMLITTEMGSRGLDLPRLSMCVNLEPPPSETHYLHRAGRLGRIHNADTHVRRGTVVTIVSDREQQKRLHAQMDKLNVPISHAKLLHGELSYAGMPSTGSTFPWHDEPEKDSSTATTSQGEGVSKTSAEDERKEIDVRSV